MVLEHAERVRSGVYLRITGALLPAPRPRLGKHGAYLPARYRKHRDRLRELLTEHIPADKRSYSITLTVFRDLPVADRRYGDVDNLLKTVMDALGVDDLYVVSAVVRKCTGENRIVLSVEWV